MPLQQRRWHEFSSRGTLETAAATAILASAQRAIGERGLFRIVLAGGTTPRKVYQALRLAETNWSAWHIYFGDERCLPPADPQRNSALASSAWLDQVAIPRPQVHPIPAELGPAKAALFYAQELTTMGEGNDFDLVLLGLGEDGHTASLFPGQAWENVARLATVIPVLHAPKPPPQRVSLSPARLSGARQVLFLVSGADKRTALQDWRDGAAIPASRITPAGGVDIFFSTSADS
jgi:6-phosphogluconolactonase